jgi:5-methylcytosine-specific restriction endonuclease McrA
MTDTACAQLATYTPSCRYCAAPFSLYRPRSRDHILPRARRPAGVDYGVLNLAMVCKQCNADKRDMTLIQFLAVLIARRDPRAGRVASLIVSLAARDLLPLCGG